MRSLLRACYVRVTCVRSSGLHLRYDAAEGALLRGLLRYVDLQIRSLCRGIVGSHRPSIRRYEASVVALIRGLHRYSDLQIRSLCSGIVGFAVLTAVDSKSADTRPLWWH